MRRTHPFLRQGRFLVTLASLLHGCESEESERISVPVIVDASSIAPALTDLGYTVTLTKARTALRDLQFTVGGEAHTTLFDRVEAWLVPTAHAHPGHHAGGDITGELAGPLIIDWMKDGAVLGSASLIPGRYRGANFFFRQTKPADGSPGDPLIGHTSHIEGTATKTDRTVAFVALIDIDEHAQLVGAPLHHDLKPGVGTTLGLRLLPVDPSDPKDTLFNGVDFFALADSNGQVAIAPGQEIHNLLRRRFQLHDHYDVKPR